MPLPILSFPIWLCCTAAVGKGTRTGACQGLAELSALAEVPSLEASRIPVGGLYILKVSRKPVAPLLFNSPPSGSQRRSGSGLRHVFAPCNGSHL
jgi:hypothetical protein